ncbi:hypothetical protein M9Y10_045685 [Tritrichomonas musculus]|uniref:Helicase ATP-binding domain-containing protein n=1 Tax=Tritrichomonas musculus TaxID=1915356 RepID=A0ABR2JXR0_9EUKA
MKIVPILDYQRYHIRAFRSFICESSTGSGKRTAIREWIINTIPEDSKYIVIVPTVIIAIEFYKKICASLDTNAEEMDKSIKVCVKENAFTEFKKAIGKSVPIAITTYSTASKCLGSIIELFYTKLKDRIGFYKPDGKPESNIEETQTGANDSLYEHTLVIDETHFLLENISLIEICREFNNVALFSATVDDISCLSVFWTFTRINPETSLMHERRVYVHKLKETVEEQHKAIAEQVL